MVKPSAHLAIVDVNGVCGRDEWVDR